ncbi:YcaO-like family protein [Poriferisphaera corsica]|uniref:YcaO-like family protein n=1 Tax=Poriferisphaera corsica TaxID=2528020 RepID=UPI001909ACE0|nr:YcaO-like family protein [Poriferisphaera corsica]
MDVRYNREIAVKRAVYEALQIVYATGAYERERLAMIERDLERVRHDERYSKCIRFDVGAYQKKSGYSWRGYEEVGDDGLILQEAVSVADQIERLVGRLNEFGMGVFVHELKALNHGAHVMCTHIPGVSLFFLSASGMMVPPAGRTVAAYG